MPRLTPTDPLERPAPDRATPDAGRVCARSGRADANAIASLTRRRLAPEKMDHPDVDPRELDRALAYLRWVNRRLGGADAPLRYLKRWADDWPRERAVRLLDVATGSADIPLKIADWAAETGKKIEIVAVDLHPVTLELAREHVGDRPEITLERADATRLLDRFEPDSFDYVHAGLFLHHLEDIEVLTVLRIMQRLARRAVIWNDLLRTPLTKIAVWPAALFAPPIARHDAIVSMNAGFSKREALDLARRVGLPNVTFRSHLFHRFTLVSEFDGRGG